MKGGGRPTNSGGHLLYAGMIDINGMFLATGKRQRANPKQDDMV